MRSTYSYAGDPSLKLSLSAPSRAAVENRLTQRALYSRPAENERVLETATFRLLNMCDATANVQRLAERRREARAKRAEALIAIEGQANFEGLQRFLITVETLNQERRLLPGIYLAHKPGSD